MAMGKFNFRYREQNTELPGEIEAAEEIRPVEMAALSRASNERRRKGAQACVSLPSNLEKVSSISRMGFPPTPILYQKDSCNVIYCLCRKGVSDEQDSMLSGVIAGGSSNQQAGTMGTVAGQGLSPHSIFPAYSLVGLG